MTMPARFPASLTHPASTGISSSIISLVHNILPGSLPRTIPIISHTPTQCAATLWLLLAAWKFVREYHDGVVDIAKEGDQAMQRATTAFGKVDKHLHEIKGLEMQAVQLATKQAENQNERWRETATSTKQAKTEIEEGVKKLKSQVDKVRIIIERANVVAGEGDLPFAEEMVVNARSLANRVVQGEETIGEKVEGLRRKLCELGLGEGFS